MRVFQISTALSCAVAAAWVFGHCRIESPYMDLNDAYSEIGVSIAHTANRCGAQPGYPLLLPARPSEYGVRLCSLLILQAACPFQDYPIPCLEIYTAECEACDLPFYKAE
ncbi:MAG: hypothetical protein K1X75_10605 [Leptospirales bacterium]|nr:hypothetical protein [Leptospirales bacterium]